MCGIVGVFGEGNRELVDGMLKTIYHRGPDDSHQVTRDNFSIGATRLSIIDLTGGRQPLCDETGTVWAAQNGELYNFKDIVKTLKAKGSRLKTSCDTEVLPHLFKHYGFGLPEHIDGMFAVAVYDEKENVGMLARDRMGKKPLYYHVTSEKIYFASEIKALLQIPGFQKRICSEALDAYLSFKHIPAPLSIFEGIKCLPPAHRLIFRKGEPIKVERYWSPNFSENEKRANSDEAELIEEFLSLMKNAVQRRLMSDVPVGFFLSGGIDSSLTAAIAAEISEQPIKTFTLTYGNKTGSGKDLDRKWARWVAEHYKTDHQEEFLEPSAFPDSVAKIIRCFDEPFCGTTSTYFLSGLIAKSVKVAVSGDGADELFGSYLSHRLAFPLANWQKFLETGNVDLIRPFENQTDFLKSLSDKPQWQWRAELMVFSQAEKEALLAQKQRELVKTGAISRLKQSFDEPTAKDALNRILEAEFNTIFPDQVLTFVDRLSMAHSLEVRSAFLDTQVVDFVTSLPGTFKIKNGETKYLLKKAALKYFPEDMVFRPKEGFVLPINTWIYESLESYVRETLSPSNLNKHGMFNQKEVTRLIDEIYASSGVPHHSKINKVLSLIMFQEWYHLYMDN